MFYIRIIHKSYKLFGAFWKYKILTYYLQYENKTISNYNRIIFEFPIFRSPQINPKLHIYYYDYMEVYERFNDLKFKVLPW